MKKHYLLLAGAYLLLGIGILFYAHSEPSNESLANDLAEIRTAIVDADRDAAQYSGGLIVAQIQFRKAILKNTEAMLLQKQKSILRRINLQYKVDAEVIPPASEEQISKLEQEIKEVEAQIQGTLDEAAQYRGGLIKITLLMNAETQKTTLSALRQKYYTAKYGIPMMIGSDSSVKEKAAVGKTVEDKDAL